MNQRLIPLCIVAFSSLIVHTAMAQTCGTTCYTTSGSNIYTDSSEPNYYLGSYLTISGGGDNSVGVFTGSSVGSTIAGGKSNYIANGKAGESDSYSAVSGGYDNVIGASQSGVTTPSCSYDVIAGGGNNTMMGITTVSTIGGGGYNVISGTTSTNNAVIGGGYSNTVSASLGTIPGGQSNTVSGEYGFAAGYGATASHEGSFVWSDSNGSCADTGSNQFDVCSAGGFKFVAGSASCTLTSGGSGWSCTSDRNVKRDLTPIDGEDLLEKLMQAPAYHWKFKTSDSSHLGPMAQDFMAAFELGDDDTKIGVLDLGGVAVAATQALYVRSRNAEAQVRVLQTKNTELASKVVALEQKVAVLSAIEARLAALEAKQNLHLRPARPANQATGLSWPA